MKSSSAPRLLLLCAACAGGPPPRATRAQQPPFPQPTRALEPVLLRAPGTPTDPELLAHLRIRDPVALLRGLSLEGLLAKSPALPDQDLRDAHSHSHSPKEDLIACDLGSVVRRCSCSGPQ